MADYSDSDDDMVYSTTDVLLGYAELPDQQTSEDMISHLGGIPTWLDESSPMDFRLAKCLNCSNAMALLLQLDGNIKESPYHKRMLYLFGCRSKACRRKSGSVRAVRGVKVIGGGSKDSSGSGAAQKASQKKEEPTAVPPKPAQNMGNMIFGAPSAGATNPFAGAGATSGSTSQPNPFAAPTSTASNPFMPKKQDQDPNLTSLSKTFAAAASVNDENAPSSASKQQQKQAAEAGPPSPWPDFSTIPSFPSLFLDASYEELDPESDALTKQAQELAKISKVEDDEEDENDNPRSRKSKGGGDGLEDTESPSQKAFNHFTYITGQNPEQVLRYERSGSPLLYSVTDEVGKLLSSPGGLAKAPKCKNCGERRVYELQLMPHTIKTLEEAAGIDMLVDGMEWGTIIVATCGVDCTIATGYVEEWAGVQWEE